MKTDTELELMTALEYAAKQSNSPDLGEKIAGITTTITTLKELKAESPFEEHENYDELINWHEAGLCYTKGEHSFKQKRFYQAKELAEKGLDYLQTIETMHTGRDNLQELLQQSTEKLNNLEHIPEPYQTINRLELEKKKVIQREDYEKAADIRDQLKELEMALK